MKTLFEAIPKHVTVQISLNAQKERNSPTYNLNRIHQYWSRKPLGFCRAVIYATTVPAAPEGSPELQEQLNRLVKLSAPETAFDTEFLKQVQDEIDVYYVDDPNGAPGVFDPFAGGGSIPLEAKRLGLGAKYEDCNELAQFIQYLILEVGPRLDESSYDKIQSMIPKIFDELEDELAEFYPSRTFTRMDVSSEVIDEIDKIKAALIKEHDKLNVFKQQREKIAQKKLTSAVEKQLAKKDELISTSEKRIANLDRDWFAEPWVPVFYYWARPGKCSNPACGSTYPLMPKWSLDDKRGVTFYPKHAVAGEPLEIEIVKTSTVPDFDRTAGTVAKGKGCCPACGKVTVSGDIKEVIRKDPQDFYALGIRYSPKIAVDDFEKELRWLYEYVNTTTEAFGTQLAEAEYITRKEAFRETYGYDCEPAPGWDPRPGFDFDGGHRLATFLPGWNDLLSTRQKLFYITLVDKLLQIRERGEVTKDEFAVLGLVCYTAKYLVGVTSAWVPGEGSAWYASSGSTNLGWSYNFAERTTSFLHPNQVFSLLPTSQRTSGTLQNFTRQLPCSKASQHNIITDPPYYDVICYSPLADFYYTWERAVYYKQFRKFFRNPTTSKGEDLSYTIGKTEFEDRFHEHLQKLASETDPQVTYTMMFLVKSTERMRALKHTISLSARTIVTEHYFAIAVVSFKRVQTLKR